jgi:hypothetical protein
MGTQNGSRVAAPALTTREQAVIDEVLKAMRDIDYGSVLVTIHQGEVVGIETARKMRLKS